jgi:hypothetical protein
MLLDVVRPETVSPSRMIAPAPRNPIPVTMFEATRPDSLSAPTDTEIIVKSVEPRQIRIKVLNPAALFLYSRSAPITVPISRDRPSFDNTSPMASSPNMSLLFCFFQML